MKGGDLTSEGERTKKHFAWGKEKETTQNDTSIFYGGKKDWSAFFHERSIAGEEEIIKGIGEGEAGKMPDVKRAPPQNSTRGQLKERKDPFPRK